VATAAAVVVVAIVAPVPEAGKIAAMAAVRLVAVTAVVELLAVAISPVLLTEVVWKRVDAVVAVVVLPRTMVVEAALAAAVMAVEMTTAVTAAPKVESPIRSVQRLKPGICELPG